MLSEAAVIKLDYIYELIDSMEDSVISSYEVLSNGVYEDHAKYQYVLKKDTNPTWLSSRKDAFIKKSTILKDFISEVIRNYYDAKRT